jgi:bifunctional DNA-binding transcriptional regulator/antitoxin component of YhaV-PrlF toxin-antitoxin module
MELLKLGERGQLSLPASILHELRLEPETMLTAELTPDGAILLRPAVDDLIEIYDDERLAEFEEENRLTDEEVRRLEQLLGKQ